MSVLIGFCMSLQFALRLCSCILSQESRVSSGTIHMLQCILSSVAAVSKVMRDQRTGEGKIVLLIVIIVILIDF